MNPITDLNILHHHRVNYGARIERDGSARRSRGLAHRWFIAALVPVLVIVSNLPG